MSDFGDQLRENLARREAEARAAAEAQSAQAEAASISLVHPDDVAAALVGDVFRPLVEEFGEVMQAEGGSTLCRRREERPTQMRPAAGRRLRGRKTQIRISKQIINSKTQ